MEREEQIKDDFNREKQEGSTQEYGASDKNKQEAPHGSMEPTDRQEGSTALRDNGASDKNKQEAPHGSMEPTEQEGSTALRDNGASDNPIIKSGKKWPVKRILKAAVLFIIFFAAWFAVVQYMAADKYEAVVKVVEEGGKIGVNPMTERLDYGDLPKGNASTRFVTIENNGKMGIYVAVVKYGGIAELIKISRNNFVLNPGEKEKLELLLEMPISANKEGYEGKVVIFKLPKF